MGMRVLPVDARSVNHIKSVKFEKDIDRLSVGLTRRPAFKVILIDSKEVMIAFRDVSVSKDVKAKLESKTRIERIHFNMQQNNVGALVVNTKTDIRTVESRWIDSTETLVVKFNWSSTPIRKKKSKIPVKGKGDLKRKKKKVAVKIVPETSRTIQEEDIAPEPIKPEPVVHLKKSNVSGSIDDLIDEVADTQCGKTGDVKVAVDYCKKKRWKEAMGILEAIVENSASSECLETAYYLRGYAFLMMNEKMKGQRHLEVATVFQEAISYYSSSKYIPYGMSALGKMFMAVGNYDEAMGYYKILLSDYKEFRGMPEVKYSLGLIQAKKKKYKAAISAFKEVIKKYPHSRVFLETKIELGKALFEINNFSESLRALNQVMESIPSRIYESSDLLLCMGNSYYHTGKYKNARKFLSEAVNFFPEIESKHVVLSRIGDTYMDQGQEDKAKKVFEFVIDKFPGTDGFVISSMRMARSLESPEEKERIYKDIINRFPENPMSNLALLRLAELKYNEKEFSKSIETAKQLLAKRSRSLRKEALYIMERAYTSDFENLLKEGDYLNMLELYEKDRRVIDRFENPELSFMVGKGYLRAHLFERAHDSLKTAYGDFENEKRSADLIFSLGVSMQESGRQDDALDMMDRYVRFFSKGKNIVDVYFRKGSILLNKKNYAKAVKNYQQAFRRSGNDGETVKILLDQSRAYKGLGDIKKQSSLLVKAINILSSSPTNYAERLNHAYRQLGEAYMQQKAYPKATNAYIMVKKFSMKDQEYPDISYKLGESYQKSNFIKQAATAYNEVIASGDSFWGKLAEEKLKGITLEQRMKKS